MTRGIDGTGQDEINETVVMIDCTKLIVYLFWTFAGL